MNVKLSDADMTEAKIRHSDAELVVILTFATRLAPDAGHQIGIQVRTNENLYRDVDMMFDRSHADRWLYGYRGDSETAVPQCDPGLMVNNRAKRITVIVERRCLNNPRWVQVQIQHDRQGHGPREDQFDYWDNPHNNRDINRQWSPRVYAE